MQEKKAKIYFAIKNEDLSSKSKIIKNILRGESSIPQLHNKKGLLFSNSVLENFIEKENKFGENYISLENNRTIRSLSSGEQKKALLAFLINQKADFLVLENPFESLDTNSVFEIKERLNQVAKGVSFIQIFNRKEEILPVITHFLEIKNDEIIAINLIENYQEKEIFFNVKIPKPIHFYENIPEILISLKNVDVAYDDSQILKNINWSVNKNEFWQLIGANGSGKSTILSMIYGNNSKAYNQDVYLFGKKKGSGESVWDIKQKIGYFSPSILELFQRRVTVLDIILSGFFDSIGLYKTPSTLQKNNAREWLRVLDLESDTNKNFKDVSITKQRLILLVRAMVKNPPLLILDEPLINLDTQGTALVVALINKIAKENTTTIIFVSHRKVEHLEANLVYELTPSKNGSTGKIKP